MTTRERVVTAGGIGDAAVRKAAGRGWTEWFAILDAFDVGAHGHAAAARHVATEHACGDWWSQMVVVGYEQARGLRRKGEKLDGFAANVSRTLPASIAALYRAWQDEETRRRWLPDAIAVRRATPERSLRITWPDGTSVAVYFWVKGEDKSQVQVNHEKLPDEAAATAARVDWTAALDRLAALLAG